MSKFKVGDLVEVLEEGFLDDVKVGATGVVVDINKDYPSYVGVDFGEDIDGHSCNEHCANKQGWYINEDHLKVVDAIHQSLHKTKWIELMQRKSNENGTYIYIREPWLVDGKAVSILPFRRESGTGYIQFLLRCEMSDSPVAGTVKGGMDKEGETPIECAVRELAEETGFIAETFNMIQLGQVRPSKLSTTKLYLFAVDVTDLPHQEPTGDGTLNEANATCQWVSEMDAIGYEDPLIHATILRLYNNFELNGDV